MRNRRQYHRDYYLRNHETNKTKRREYYWLNRDAVLARQAQRRVEQRHGFNGFRSSEDEK